MCHVITRERQLALQAKKQRMQLAVYFFTGIMLPLPPPLYRYQTSTLTMTKNTIFICNQTGHRS